jgi:hypothetical protein
MRNWQTVDSERPVIGGRTLKNLVYTALKSLVELATIKTVRIGEGNPPDDFF